MTTTEEIQSTHGPYTPAVGWKMFDKPASTEEAWVEKKKSMKRGDSWWEGKKLAHIFDDGGWDEGTFQSRSRTHLVFYYKAVPMHFAHSLLLEEHGTTGSLVDIERSK